MTYLPPAHHQLKALLFDFDGTLLDSFPAHYQAYVVTADHFDIAMTPQLFRQTYTPNWLAMYAALGIPQTRWAEADEIWLAEVRKHQPQLFPGVRDLLDSLRRDYLLALVTSGSRDRVNRDLVQEGIRDYFQVIVTGDDVTQPKPEPEALRLALEQLRTAPLEALYIGDAREDCWMAQAAGVPFVGIAGEFATVTDVADCVKLSYVTEIESLFTGR